MDFSKLVQPDTPQAVIDAYASYAQEAQTRDFGLLEEDVVVLDTETTGLSFKTCELIEIAAARLEGRRVVAEFQAYVKPSRPIPEEITQLTGITNADVANALPAEDVVAQLMQFVAGAPVVAHNATFDRSFIERVRGGVKVSDRWVDSLALSRIALPRLTSHTLSHMAEIFECSSVSHRAIDDVRALAGVWRVLLVGLSHLPAGLLVALAETHPEVTWAYRPIFEHLAAEKTGEVDAELGAGARRAARLFDLVGVRQDLVEDAKRLPRPDALTFDEPPRAAGCDAVAAVFDKQGPLSHEFERYEPRPEQVEMALAVDATLATSKNAVLEGGTGVGKSLAYLVPLVLYAQKNGVTVGVATKTNTLSDQLLAKDLPLLKEALPQGVTYTCLKGYDHYPCLRKVQHALRAPLPTPPAGGNPKSTRTAEQDMLTALAVTLANACQEVEGDLDLMGIRWKNVPRNLITTTPDECLKNACPFYPEKCLLHGARRRAQGADVVVTNHALLLRDIAADGNILPPIRTWVVDEAHSFEAEARKQWALEANAEGMRAALERLGSTRAGTLHRALAQLATCEASTLATGLLSKAAHEASRTTLASSDFFSELHTVAEWFQAGSGERQAFLVNDTVRASSEWQRLQGCSVTLLEALEALTKALQEAIAALHQVPGATTAGLEDPARDLTNLLAAIKLVMEGSDSSYVYSLELASAYPRPRETLVAQKLDIGQELASEWYPTQRNVLYCSATMSVAGKFDHFLQSVGLASTREGSYRCLTLPSSYDYNYNMAALVVEDVPDPRQPGYVNALVDLLFETHVAMGGSVLTLFTNRKEMEQAYGLLQPRLAAAGLALFMQDKNSNPRYIREKFIKDEQLSLFALKSFWEGFDAAGSTLRCVVIPKLPFGNPHEPLALAREERYPRSWWRFALPESVLAVKQAAGRLLRTSTDTGVLVLADSRLVSKGYGRTFIASLPTENVNVVQASHVGSYIESWRRTHE
jgi:ATP-dependent DNA helicase DinG